MSEAMEISDEKFDVIVVGAGPAGCVLANRLSEDPQQRVLLIEAGPDIVPGAEPANLLDPFALAGTSNTAFLWPGLIAETGPDRGSGTRRATGPFMQGYGVGGASNINGMGVDWGQPGDFEEWRSHGAAGWDWNGVLPYFRKLEHDLDFSGESPLHGRQGVMPVRRLPRSRWAPFAAALGDTLERRGFAEIQDYLLDFRDGFAAAPTNCLPDRRVSASMAYLAANIRRRSNLTIRAGTCALRLSFDGACAVGIVAQGAGTTKVIRGRQIIISCGAIQTPTLLMRSGIGPAQQLSRHGIRVLRDMPGVGANLQNHPTVTLAVHLRRQAVQARDNPWLLQNWLRYSSNLTGCPRGDMHLMPFNKCGWHELGERVGALALTVLKPYSVGQVTLARNGADVAPRVEFNLLSDPRDFDRLIGGLRFTLQLLMDPELALTRNDVFLPSSRVAANLSPQTRWNRYKAWAVARALDRDAMRRILLGRSRVDPRALLANDDGVRDLVQQLAHPQYHVCGTARMGHSADSTAVVDSEGRVHGIDALRIADASIFPTLPRAYTHFPVMMAAEKIADAVKATRRRSQARQIATAEQT